METRAASSRVDIPEKLGRYRVIAALADGGMGQVFLAVQRGAYASNKLVVVKKVKTESLDEPELVKMFVDEARIAMRLNHPNIVNTFDFVAEGDALYLTMEFLEGHSLLHVVRRAGRSAFPLDLHLWVLSRVLGALEYMHSFRDFDGSALGIVHRDVSPSNVILTHRGEVKIVDFGIAKSADRMTVTQMGTMKGKLGYVSPEQCQLAPVTAQSDIYAVGVMLWEAMARKRRWQGDTPAQVFLARLSRKELPIQEVWPEAPPRLVEICERALAFDPFDRYGTAREFKQDLDEYMASLPESRRAGSLALSTFLDEHLGDEIAGLRRTIEERIAGEEEATTGLAGALGEAEPSDEEASLSPPTVTRSWRLPSSHPPGALSSLSERPVRKVPSVSLEPSQLPSTAPGPSRKSRGTTTVAAVVVMVLVTLSVAGYGVKTWSPSAPMLTSTAVGASVFPAPRFQAVVEETPRASASSAPVVSAEPPSPIVLNSSASQKWLPRRERRSEPARAQAAVTPGAPASAPSRGAAVAEEEPGVDLGRPASRGRRPSIDEKDPYSP